MGPFKVILRGLIVVWMLIGVIVLAPFGIYLLLNALIDPVLRKVDPEYD